MERHRRRKSAILLSEVQNDDYVLQLFGKPATLAKNPLYQGGAALNTVLCT